jgi:ribosomal protein S27AE
MVSAVTSKQTTDLSVDKVPKGEKMCFKCSLGYYLGPDGKCAQGDVLANCDIFTSKSICGQCSHGYWQVTNSAGL